MNSRFNTMRECREKLLEQGSVRTFGRVILMVCVFSLVIFHLKGEEKKPVNKASQGLKVTTLPLSENLIISAENVSPAMDEKTGDLIGLSASGKVSIKVKPKGTEKWIYVTCGKLVYDVSNDEIVLKENPVVKSGIQVLRATSDKTYVNVSRKTGKWVIKGPHKIELKFK